VVGEQRAGSGSGSPAGEARDDREYEDHGRCDEQICERLAPDQVSRRPSLVWSRRKRVDASTAKPTAAPAIATKDQQPLPGDALVARIEAIVPVAL